jgi:GcrA cell cycle regulator
LNAFWTVEKEKQLTELWTAGLTATEIVAKIGGGLSRCAVLGKAHRMDLASRIEAVSSQEKLRRLEHARTVRNARLKYRRENARYAEIIGKPITAAPLETKKPKVIEMPASSINIPFADLRDFSGIDANQCRFIEGDGDPYMACGNITPAGGSWCAHHRLIVFGRETQISSADRQRRSAHMRRICNIPSAIICSDVDALNG